MTEPLIGLLEDVWTSTGEVCTDLTAEQWVLPTDCSGWTVQDQIAHVIGTERMLLGDPAPEIDVDVAAFPHVKNDIGAFNEVWVESRRGHSGDEVLAELREVTASRLAALAALTPEQWDEEGFTPEGPGPYRKFMSIRVFDCWMHEQDVRVALGRPGHVDGPVVDLSMARLRDAMPYVVGKKAGVPQGATVVFDVAGPAGFELAVGVEGRARILEVVPVDPTVRLTMDDESFARLAGGRWPGGRVLTEARVRIYGDEALGRAIVTSMGFTI